MHESTVRLRFAGTYQAPKGRDFPAHSHATWELIYYRTGRIQCMVGDMAHQTAPGMVLLIPPGVVHSDRAVSAYSQIYVRITAPADQPWPKTCYDDTERSWDALCRTIEREWRFKDVLREEMLALLAHQLDVRLRRAHHQTPHDPWEQAIRAAEEIMEAQYALPVKITEVAKEVGMSPSRLRAHFVRLRASTPQSALQTIRLRHALDLIRNSSLKLEAIACLCGYHSASHVTRYVRRETGMSPGRLRH